MILIVCGCVIVRMILSPTVDDCENDNDCECENDNDCGCDCENDSEPTCG